MSGKPGDAPKGERDIYMVHVNSGGAVFVKTLSLFRDQGGFREPWGIYWNPVAATSLKEAARKGCDFPGAKPYVQQVFYEPRSED